MKKINKSLYTLFLLISLLFCFFGFNGCNMKAEQKSLTDQFITIDALIRQDQIDSALKELKKAQKRVYDPWSYLGVYKRYCILGESDLAEKVISKAVKSFNNNLELKAVYADFLIDACRFDEAEKVAKDLIGSNYSSFYSEVVFKSIKHNIKTKEINNESYNEDFYNVFFDAYKVSLNPLWIRDCAIFDLNNGRYDNIGSIAPSSFSDLDDAYFWGMALYDAGKYYEAINALSAAQDFYLSCSENSRSLYKSSITDIIALMSDCYMAVADVDMAEKARQGLIFNMAFGNESESFISGIDFEDPLLPVILTNSAIWAYNNDFNDECADLLFYVVNTWPDYVPGLVLYSDFAFNCENNRVESPEQAALRDAGIATLEMEQYDNRRKIPLSDALYRINDALKRNNNPYLNIVNLDLKYKSDTSLSMKDKYRDLWAVLEDSNECEPVYKSLLIQYALNFLLSNGEINEGWRLYKNHIIAISNFGNEIALNDNLFWEAFTENIRSYDLGLAEFGGYFASLYKFRNEAIRILEYCVYESSGILEDGLISSSVSAASCLNLADIYFSIGRNDDALDLYGRVAGRESKKSLRSEIYYRIACIYAKEGDIKNALRSAEYACTLYPDNVRASLLKDKLLIK